MTGRGARRLVVAGLVAVVALVVGVDAGLPAGPTFEALALGGATIAALGAVARLPVAGRDERRGASQHVERDEVTELAARVASAMGSAGGAWFALAPTLRRLVLHRCARHGVDPDDPAAVERLVGTELAALAGPAATRPVDRSAPGPDHATLARAVTRLEQL
jgi:hypothetical protein